MTLMFVFNLLLNKHIIFIHTRDKNKIDERVNEITD